MRSIKRQVSIRSDPTNRNVAPSYTNLGAKIFHTIRWRRCRPAQHMVPNTYKSKLKQKFEFVVILAYILITIMHKIIQANFVHLLNAIIMIKKSKCLKISLHNFIFLKKILKQIGEQDPFCKVSVHVSFSSGSCLIAIS